ncbi:MbeD/MobD family mobilization/exclusion protein [Corynebacterium marquesiae]|uniref:MbeD/MobD family mobilization/exclusion protein n=1 Tax=Corynebacterium marquesiae TaxID=2913503 RepID=UPI00254EE97A|nr:MbeD/MobD family mobilization/exclusion protein [Corynebacterium marquesiae]MDK8496853.1 MbeD/MobD family mobilization/exclusion protein [Corynebacterium marquesiae]
MTPLTTIIATGTTSTITGIASWVTATINAHSKERQTHEQTRYPEWKAFVDTIQQETHQLTDRVNNLQDQVDTLRGRVNTLSHKYNSALSHITEWRQAHPEEIPHHPAPTAIKPDL